MLTRRPFLLPKGTFPFSPSKTCFLKPTPRPAGLPRREARGNTGAGPRGEARTTQLGTDRGRSFRAALAGASATVARVWQRLRGRRRGGEGSRWDKERRRGAPMGVVGPARPGGSLRDPSGAFGFLRGSCTDEGSRRFETSSWPSLAGCGRHGGQPPGLVAAEAEGAGILVNEKMHPDLIFEHFFFLNKNPYYIRTSKCGVTDYT